MNHLTQLKGRPLQEETERLRGVKAFSTHSKIKWLRPNYKRRTIKNQQGLANGEQSLSNANAKKLLILGIAAAFVYYFLLSE